MEFKTHKILKRIRLISFNTFNGDSVLRDSAVPDEACFRRLYLLTQFFTLSLEYLRLSKLWKRTGSIGTITLPFKGIVMAINDSELVQDLKAYINDVVEANYSINTEESLKTYVYLHLFTILFRKSKFNLGTKFELKISITPVANTYYIDYCCIFQPNVLPKNHLKELIQSLPGLLIEIQLSNLEKDLPHKDMAKMTVAMSKVLLARIKLVLTESTIDEARKLKVFGILVGGFWMEFVVAQALISDIDSQGRVQVAVAFQSSEKHGRFPLVATNKFHFDQALAGSLYNEKSNSPIEALDVIRRSKAKSTISISSEDHSASIQEEKLITDLILEEGLLRKDTVPNTKSDLKLEPLAVPDGGAAEVITCRALERFVESFFASEDHFLKMVREAQPPASGSLVDFVFDGRLFFVPRAASASGKSPIRTPHDKIIHTPKKAHLDVEMKQIGVNFLEFKVPQRSTDLHGREIVTVKKYFNPYEIEIYNLQAVKSCPFIPKLLEFHELDYDLVILKLEALSGSLNGISLKISTYDVDDFLFNWLASGLLLGILSALETLHNAGFVHSDLSPGNVCFSDDEGIWKLIDFNQSLPIEQSLRTPRTFGTKNFVSKKAKQSGILEPVDDYVSLAKVVSRGFPKDWYSRFELNAKLNDLLQEMIDAKEINSNWYKSAVIIHEMACAKAGKTGDKTLAYINSKKM